MVNDMTDHETPKYDPLGFGKKYLGSIAQSPGFLQCTHSSFDPKLRGAASRYLRIWPSNSACVEASVFGQGWDMSIPSSSRVITPPPKKVNDMTSQLAHSPGICHVGASQNNRQGRVRASFASRQTHTPCRQRRGQGGSMDILFGVKQVFSDGTANSYYCTRVRAQVIDLQGYLR